MKESRFLLTLYLIYVIIIPKGWGIYMIFVKKKYGFADMFMLSFKISPFHTVLNVLSTIVSSLMPTFTIFVTASFIDTALAIFNGTAQRSDINLPIAMLMGITLYGIIIGVIFSFINSRKNIYFRKRVSPEILEKRAQLEYKYMEDPKMLDLINRVCGNIEGIIMEMLGRVLDIVNIIVFSGGILVTLFTQVWWVSIAITLTAVPILFIAAKAGKKSYEADKEMTKIDRRVWYLSNVMTDRGAVGERALFNYTEHLNEQYMEKFNFARKFRLKVSRNNFIKNKMGGIICTIFSVAVMFALLGPVVSGEIEYGMFIALMGATFALAARFSWGINWTISDIAHKMEYLKELTEFVHLETIDNADVLPEKDMTFNEIKFVNVSFKYPGTEKLILNKVNFNIENGKHYSFVGVNGAGKTTVTKLLTGLYNEYEGEILIDGTELKQFTQAQLKGLCSVIYQDFAGYSISMRENIALGNTNDMQNNEKIEEAVKLADLTDAVEKLKDGLDTPLGKIKEDGVDLSGGEWQRVAIARSIVNPAPLRILDEPTAALDPISESELYKNFEQISRGMTTIFISHRLGSTKLAETIYVLDEGQITESGSHEQLMKENGMYAKMFESQAAWYSNENREGDAVNG